MASQPVLPDDSEDQSGQNNGSIELVKQASAEAAAEAVENLEEGVQDVHHELRKGTISQIVLTVLATLAICYFAKLPLVVIFTSILIAFILEPAVRWMTRIHIPRGAGSFIAVLLLMALLAGLTHFFYARAVDFAHELPRTSGEIKKMLSKYQKNAEQLRQSAANVIPEPPEDKNAVKVKVQQETGLRGMIGSDLAGLSEVLLTVTFIPFLVYFMLTWQEHTRRATVRLFPRASRGKAYRTIGGISDMMRAFIVGNFIIGLFTSVASVVIFGFLHLPYFYFLGFISGFLSLIPYLGIVLAVLPPIASGLGTLHGSGIVIILVSTVGLHLFAMNVLYPKVIGGRLEINPLAVTLGLLIWGWIWGAMGLILAVPVIGTIKIICDNIEGLHAFGDWLGEGEQPEPAK